MHVKFACVAALFIGCGSCAPAGPASRPAAIQAALSARTPTADIDMGVVCDVDSSFEYAKLQHHPYKNVPGVRVSEIFIGHEPYKYSHSELAKPPYQREHCRRITWAAWTGARADREGYGIFGTVPIGRYVLYKVGDEFQAKFGKVTPFRARFVANSIGKVLAPGKRDWDATAFFKEDGSGGWDTYLNDN